MEIETGENIPNWLKIVHLNQKTQSLINALSEFNPNNDKYTCLIFGSCS